MDYKQQLKSDFYSFDEIIKDSNHVVRRLFSCYINGDYGFEIYERNLKRWQQATTSKKKRSFVISTFIDAQALDCQCTSQQVQKWLMKNIGIKKLEQLNLELINDVTTTFKEVA
jgi:hypothetical protein